VTWSIWPAVKGLSQSVTNAFASHQSPGANHAVTRCT